MKSLVAGVVLLVVATAGAFKVSDQSQWVPAQGKVLSVTEQCEMTATERGIVTKTKYSATIDCDLVEAFEAYNSDKVWRVSRAFSGDVRVTSAAAKALTVNMKLQRVANRDPRKGDTLDLRQDPANPGRVETTSSVESFPIITGLMGAAGLALGWFGLGSPMPRRRQGPVDADDYGAPAAAPAAPAYAYDTPVPAATAVQPSYQPAITDYSRARAAVAPRKAFGRRGA